MPRFLVSLLALLLCTAADWGDVSTPAAGPPRIVGTYTAGCIQGAVPLPPEAAGYEAVRLSRNRHWGHPSAIDFVASFAEQVRQRGQSHLYIGDIAMPRGGPFSFGHASHQVGLDIDIWFERAPRPRLAGPQREDILRRSIVRADEAGIDDEVFNNQHAALLQLSANMPNVDRMFVHKWIKRRLCETTTGNRAWLRKLVPWIGHDSHFHVRLHCPPGQPECQPQAGYAQDDGCGDALDLWFRAPPVVAPPPGTLRPPYRPRLPPACQAVLNAP
jgi:penicillin-insensitive murein endopeptidase